jgi:tetratricopeptide (TPR) repeat protein
MSLSTISRLKARYVVETEKWKVAPVTSGLPPHELLAIGLSASRTGNQDILKQVETELASMAKNSDRGGNPMARGFGGNYTKISSLQVSALVKVYEGQAEAALAVLDEAEGILLSMRPPNGPASPIKPLHELYGEILLELGQSADAIEKFNTSLLRLPNRPRSLLGLARSYAKTGDYANARVQYAKLAEVWSGRGDFVEMQEVRRFLETTDDQ